MHSGNAAAMPLVRNAATFSFCHASRSVRITTAILVSKCMSCFPVSLRDAPRIVGWAKALLRRAHHANCGGHASLCPDLCSPPLRLRERLWRVDIEKRAVALNRHFRHRLAMPGYQVAGADIAVERHQLVEEAPRPQHRIAAPVVA